MTLPFLVLMAEFIFLEDKKEKNSSKKLTQPFFDVVKAANLLGHSSQMYSESFIADVYIRKI